MDQVIQMVDEGPEGAMEDATECTRNWKAAQPDEKKGSFIRWDQTGIFTALCRHGIIFSIVDMRRSGELYVFHYSLVRLY
jgi:hypothetical protein